ncbi:30S ribosomal protein S15, partial [Streptococcus salivarius]|nr:30S ribosomal protein S15 [Streptococcus salivarius]
MMLTPARKKELIETYRINEADTGSPEVQIAIL